jgi:hypothetical protein
MNLKWRILMAFAVPIFLNSSSTAFASWSYVQRKVSSGKFPIHSACIMPPQAQLIRIGVKGAGAMDKESDAWAVALQTLVESHLKSDGIAINSAINPLSSGASDDEIRQVILQIQQNYHAILPLMNKKPGGIGKSAYTLDDQVAMLPCAANSDVLVFIQGEGQVLTDGKATMTFLVGGAAEGATVIVTLADAKTGEILGLIRMRPGDGFLDSAEDTFGEPLDTELSIMNVGTARKNAKAHEH